MAPKARSKAPVSGNGDAPLSGTIATRDQAHADEAEETARQVQGETTGVIQGAPDRSRQIEFMGEWFRIAPKVGVMPLMRFAHAAADELDTGSLESLAAMYDMLRDCIHPGADCTCGEGWIQKYPDPDNPGKMAGGKPDWHVSSGAQHDEGCPWDPGDWRRFERHATVTKAEADDLLPITRKVMEILSVRPT